VSGSRKFLERSCSREFRVRRPGSQHTALIGSRPSGLWRRRCSHQIDQGHYDAARASSVPLTAIAPAFKAAGNQPGNERDNTIKQNVILNVKKLKAATPIIDKFVTEKKVRVVDALYHLGTGQVELFS
jgi:hypothetical protein